MRILASNPDTLGDFVLRQPLYRALAGAGHELMLVVRQSVLPLVPYVAPGAKAVVLPYETYAHDIEEQWDRFDDVFDAARAFEPDLLLVAPYRWTRFDEKLAEVLPAGVRKVGMSGHLYAGDPHAGAAPVSTMRFDAAAEVAADQLEVEKNAALCAAVLGAALASVVPALSANEADLGEARGILGRLGLEPGEYWVACVGGTANVAIKTWHAESWGRVLGEWAKRHRRRFLFVGLPEEEPAARQVLAAMRDVLGSDEAVARYAAVWMEPDGTVPELLALTQLSSGYVGHDTGPMHVAAAMGKPALAVFGGGTWPRFRPAVEPSVALLVGVPCVGCGWVCAFEQPYCIKAVPADEVLRAAADLEAGRVTGREARVIEPDEALQRRMIREGAGLAQRQVRERAELARRLQASYRDRETDVTALHAARQRDATERTAEVEQLRTQLQAVHDEARRAAEAFAARDADADRVRQELGATLERQTAEVNRLRAEIRGMIRDVERSNGNGMHRTGGESTPGAKGPARPASEAPGAPDEISQLRAAIERLEARVRDLEPRVGAARRPLRQVLTDLVIGGRRYRRRAQPHLPKVTVVTPVPDDYDAADVPATIRSVVAQNYHDLELIVVLASADSASTKAALETLRPFEDRIDHLLAEPGAGAADAVAKGLAAAAGDVLHVLHPGDALEPGAVLRVAEYFSRRAGVQAVYSEDALCLPDGWKFAAPPQPTADVHHLLRRDTPFRNGVFFRNWAYRALGPIKPQLGAAAEWELWVRLARRFELRRIEGHFRSIAPAEQTIDADTYKADLGRARAAFEQTFGAPGRLRCRVIAAANAVFDRLRAWTRGARFFFPIRPTSAASKPLPPAIAPPFAAGQPVCPLNDRLPDRFLFSAPDTTGGDRDAGLPGAVHHVYYDSLTGTALAYPPVPLDRLDALYAARSARRAAEIVPPDPSFESPYAGYRGPGLAGLLGAALSRVPSPWWWFRTPNFDDTSADEVLRLLGGLLDRSDAAIRVLNVGCYEGPLLDRLKRDTRWQTFGAETNPAAAAAARANGHTVWEVSPQDAPLVLPVGQSFDVIFLADMIEHLPHPLLVLRRLRQLLVPGGLLALNLPNLDSAHAALFGPTWSHWQLPYHRTLTGRAGLRRLAALADFKVLRLRTRTHPYPACVSAQLNALGLAAVVPDTVRFSNEIASRGVRLTGWSRLLWDWRGRGDSLYAVLKLL
jgi:ADP-heptose:LPS heptosyltransferase/SAM-dependent methyltransferase